MNISPAVVTRLVADLENHLGVRLIQRTTRQLTLTQAGRTFLVRTLAILDDIDDAEAAVRTESSEPRGLLRVMAPTAFACHFLARHLPRFMERFPAVRLAVVHGMPETAESDYDVTIIPGIGPLHGEFVAHRLGTVHGILCAAHRYLAQAGTPEHPLELARYRCISFQNPNMPRAWMLEKDAGQANQPEVAEVEMPQVALRVSHAEMALAAAMAGVGIALLPAYMTEDAIATGSLIHVMNQWRTRPITYHAAIPSRRHVPASTRAFVEFIKQAFSHSASASSNSLLG